MRSMILKKVSVAILPIVTIFSIYLLLRGHDEPGGGFIAGLVVTSATALLALAYGTEVTRRYLTDVVLTLFALGLLVAALSGVFAMLLGAPFLTHYHVYVPVPGVGDVHLSTALTFDLGVFFLVVASTTMAMSVFAEAVE